MTRIPTTRYVKSDDVHVAYQVVGEGPVDVLWVPGFVSNMEAGSLADAAATPYVNRAAMLGLDFLWRDKDHGKHRLQEWFERMQNRSSFERSIMSDSGLLRSE